MWECLLVGICWYLCLGSVLFVFLARELRVRVRDGKDHSFLQRLPLSVDEMER